MDEPANPLEPPEAETAAAEEKRQPGAQPGNKNALKHGFYAKLLFPDEKKCLAGDSLGNLNDEVNLLRALIFRTIKSFKENPPTNFVDHVRALRAVTLAISCLQNLFHAQVEAGNDGRLTYDEFSEQLLASLLPIDFPED